MQKRFRVSPSEDQHLEAMASEAGFPHLSDYIRAVALDSHLVVVGNAGFFLVPAFNSDETARAEARENLERLLAVASAAPQTSQVGSGGTPSSTPDTGQEAAGEPGESASGGDISPPAQAGPPGDDFAARLAERQAAVITAPQLETDEDFVARRSGQLRLEGHSPLMATSLAEAELRQARAAAEAPPPAAVAPPELEPGDRPRPDRETAQGAPACSACGAALVGTGFCANCGAADALSTPTTNGET